MSVPIIVKIEQAGMNSDVHQFEDPDGEQSARLVQRQRGSSGATLTISVGGKPGQLHIAVSDDRAFVGLDHPDGIFQYSSGSIGTDESEPMLIGGQVTEIDARYVWSVDDAAVIVQSWIVDRDGPGGWERQ